MNTLLKQIAGFAICAGIGSAGAVETPVFHKDSSPRSYQGFYVFGGGSWTRGKVSAYNEDESVCKAKEKNGFGLSVGGAYLHAFGNFLVGVEAGCHFFPKIIIKESEPEPEDRTGSKDSTNLYPCSPSVAIACGYSFGAYGMAVLTVGGTYSGVSDKTTSKRTNRQTTQTNDYCSFRPEVGIKYAYEFWKGLGVSVEAHHAFGGAKKYKVKGLDGKEMGETPPIKTDRTMIGVNLFYHF
ncbi:MAG: hypothetical protein LBF76_00770 [Holosporales bacterium]|jgi:hypothetical protein|nr:hypothetical protein [Holosporales bacterium]